MSVAPNPDTNPETIAAIATPPGRGGIGIIRVSGPLAFAVAKTVAGILPEPRRAGFRVFRDPQGEAIDQGLLLCFPAPHSFTGEDVVELQAHGSPTALAVLLEALCRAGARLARPGEFSERAFINGRIDLAQAEAVADLIDAGSRAAARAATRNLQGEFSRRVQDIVEILITLRVQVEASVDFADEELPALAPAGLRSTLASLVVELVAIEHSAAQGRRLRDGMNIAILGAPNVGKSSLLNRLAGVEAAIVSPLAGTTRDVLREQLVVDGLPLKLVDTAGLRETADPVEREGVRRARLEATRAEVLLYLVDDRLGETDADRRELQALAATDGKIVLVRNKCDLSGAPPGTGAKTEIDGAPEALRISAASGAGVPALIARLKHHAGLVESDQAHVYLARSRHLEALRAARVRVQEAMATTQAAIDVAVLAEELRLVQEALGNITGRFTSEDLLGRIFSSFCLGK